MPPFDPNTGGVQMSTFKMSNYFVSVGHRVTVFSFEKDGHIKDSEAELFHAEFDDRHFNGVNLQYLTHVIGQIKPDIVINQMPYEHSITEVLVKQQSINSYLLIGCLRNTLFSVKLNLDEYCESVFPKIVHPILKNAFGKFLLLQIHKRRHRADLKIILDSYDKFVMFGPPNKEEIGYFIGDYKREKLEFIPNSIPDTLSEMPKKDKVILSLGRLSIEQKRADLLLPLWERLQSQLPDWHFWIVGGGPQYENIERNIIERNISRVKLWGKQDPWEFYTKASVFIMTSAFEGFPNTLIEAQSRGAVPVVMNSYPMVEWIVKDKEDGFLITPFDLDAMADRILQLAKSEAELKHVGELSLSNAQRFVISEVGKAWEKLFDKHLSRNKE